MEEDASADRLISVVHKVIFTATVAKALALFCGVIKEPEPIHSFLIEYD